MQSTAMHEASTRVSQMSPKMLKKLMENPEDLAQFVQQLSTMQSFERTRQELTQRNRHLAMKNLKRESDLTESRKKLTQTMAELVPLREKYLVLPRGGEDETRSPELVLGKLQSLLHENERSNDEMVETFFQTCRNDQDVEIFMKNFLSNRQKTVELRVIVEKFTQLYQIEKRKR